MAPHVMLSEAKHLRGGRIVGQRLRFFAQLRMTCSISPLSLSKLIIASLRTQALLMVIRPFLAIAECFPI